MNNQSDLQNIVPQLADKEKDITPACMDAGSRAAERAKASLWQGDLECRAGRRDRKVCDRSCPARTILRERQKGLRAALPREESAARSLAAQQSVLAHRLFGLSHSIALYMPIKGEVDTGLLLTSALNLGKAVYLPRTQKNGLMEFAPVQDLDDLERGNFGILEPKKLIPGLGPTQFAPDLMLVPGLAFDCQGNRLGFGGGYYDRFLGARKGVWPLVGFCFDFQLVDCLQAMPWDCKMDYVFTENGCREVKECRPAF